MSKSFNTPASNTKTVPYCKVCHDAGRPASEYTSHYVKDQPGPGGKVVCPTLLNQKCRICQTPGHTSTYCSQYRSRRDDRREIETPRYIEREQPRRDDRRDISFNRLREDTDRHEREIRVRDETYQREQDRRSKPWLQAALVKPSERRAPYAHPHGPRVRLELESRALSSSTISTAAAAAVVASTGLPPSAFDVIQSVNNLHHAERWCDEEPEQMAAQMFLELANEQQSRRNDYYISREGDDLITMSLGGGHIQFAGYD